MSMQYGHCVVRATAIAMSSLYFTGMAPSATDSLSNVQNAFITSGAKAFNLVILARFSLVNIGLLVLFRMNGALRFGKAKYLAPFAIHDKIRSQNIIRFIAGQIDGAIGNVSG